MLQRGVAEERSDRRQPSIAGANAVVTVCLEMIQERSNQRCVEIRELKLTGLFADSFTDEREQQPERVPVRGNRVRTHLPLADQPCGEECLKRWCQRTHDRCP